MRHIILSSVACPDLVYFFMSSHKWHQFRGKKVAEYEMCVFIFSTIFVRNISHCKNNSARYDHTRAIPKSTSDWLVKKIQNREQNFIICNSYINKCITSPHICHSHLGTCCTVTLVFVVTRQRTVPPSYAAIC